MAIKEYNLLLTSYKLNKKSTYIIIVPVISEVGHNIMHDIYK